METKTTLIRRIRKRVEIYSTDNGDGRLGEFGTHRSYQRKREQEKAAGNVLDWLWVNGWQNRGGRDVK